MTLQILYNLMSHCRIYIQLSYIIMNILVEKRFIFYRKNRQLLFYKDIYFLLVYHPLKTKTYLYTLNIQIFVFVDSFLLLHILFFKFQDECMGQITLSVCFKVYISIYLFFEGWSGMRFSGLISVIQLVQMKLFSFILTCMISFCIYQLN